MQVGEPIDRLATLLIWWLRLNARVRDSGDDDNASAKTPLFRIKDDANLISFIKRCTELSSFDLMKIEVSPSPFPVEVKD